MKRRRTKLILWASAVLVAVASVSYYAGRPDVGYFFSSSLERQRLETERLQNAYRTASKLFEQQLRAALSKKDPEVAAKIAAYNSLILNARKKYVDIGKEIISSTNKFLAAHSRPSIALDSFMSTDDAKTTFPDTKLMKEIVVDSVSDTPTSIREDKEDLLARYHAEVNVTISIVLGGGAAFPNQIRFIANATPDGNWTFPPVTEAKQRILASMDDLSHTVESMVNLELDKMQMSLRKTTFEQLQK